MKQFETRHLIIALSKYWAHNGYKGSRIWVHQIHMGFMTDSDAVAVHGTKESWEVGVHGSRDLPGFQHTLVSLTWAGRPWQDQGRIFHIDKVSAYVPANWYRVRFAGEVAHIFCPWVLADSQHFLRFLAEQLEISHFHRA